MQTRRLRLGDVVDDYCPRERRLSNHVVVAMVEDAIKQTRCTTCDFEHPYKDGKLPARRKKKDGTAALYEQVLEGMTDKPLLAPQIVEPERVEAPAVAPAAPVLASPAPAAAERPKSANLRSRAKGKAAAAAAPAEAIPAAASEAAPPIAAAPRVVASHAASSLVAKSSGSASHAAAPVHHPAHAPRAAHPTLASYPRHAAPAAEESTAPEAPDVEADDDNVGNAAPGGENEPLHRRTLIRATLPRPVGEVPVRQAPTFTIREAARAPKFRRPFARNARPQAGQNGVMNGPPGRQGGRGPQARGKKGGAQHAQHGAQRFGQGHGQGSGGGQGAHHAKGRQGGQGNKRFK